MIVKIINVHTYDELIADLDDENCYYTDTDVNEEIPTNINKLEVYSGSKDEVFVPASVLHQLKSIEVDSNLNLVLGGEYAGKIKYKHVVDYPVPSPNCTGEVIIADCKIIEPTSSKLEKLTFIDSNSSGDLSGWENTKRIHLPFGGERSTKLPIMLEELFEEVTTLSVLVKCPNLRRLMTRTIVIDEPAKCDLSHVEHLDFMSNELPIAKFHPVTLKVGKVRSIGTVLTDRLKLVETIYVKTALMFRELPIEMEVRYNKVCSSLFEASSWTSLKVRKQNPNFTYDSGAISITNTWPNLRRLDIEIDLLDHIELTREKFPNLELITISDNRWIKLTVATDKIYDLIKRGFVLYLVNLYSIDYTELIKECQPKELHIKLDSEVFAFDLSLQKMFLKDNRSLQVCPALSDAIFERDKAQIEQTLIQVIPDRDVVKLILTLVKESYGCE